MIRERYKRFALLMYDAAERGLLLIFSALLALVIANSSLQQLYHSYLESSISFGLKGIHLDMTIQNFINKFCMALFFLLVGIEIKREMLIGHLSTIQQRTLPFIAAFCGVVIPALIYSSFNYQSEIGMRGWAIPAATDIPFALGMLALVGKGLPVSLRIFMTAVAIIDDLLAVLIIAFFYTSNLDFSYLPSLGVVCLILISLNFLYINNNFIYLFLGIFVWFFLYKIGISPSIAGVILAAFIPLHSKGGKTSCMDRMEKLLLPWVLFLILPVFAFANCGISLFDLSLERDLLSSITVGIILGLFIGKQAGIFIPTYLLIRLRFIPMLVGANLKQLYAVTVLCGIGFTMSLFISIMAFTNQPTAIYLVQAKLGVMLGSLFSVIYAAILIKLFKKKIT
jgi:NhaA family Na+:H+ antiporter